MAIRFHDVRDSLNVSRPIQQFHTPAALKEYFGRDIAARNWFLENPPSHSKLRDYQKDANTAIEAAIANGKRQMRVAMATGTGKTFAAVIQSIVRDMKPDPRVHKEFTIRDPACGTGGFLVASHEWLVMAKDKGGVGAGAMDRDVAKRVKRKTYFGQDLVLRPRRMALMNLYLHGVERRLSSVTPSTILHPARSST